MLSGLYALAIVAGAGVLIALIHYTAAVRIVRIRAEQEARIMIETKGHSTNAALNVLRDSRDELKITTTRPPATQPYGIRGLTR